MITCTQHISTYIYYTQLFPIRFLSGKKGPPNVRISHIVSVMDNFGWPWSARPRADVMLYPPWRRSLPKAGKSTQLTGTIIVIIVMMMMIYSLYIVYITAVNKFNLFPCFFFLFFKLLGSFEAWLSAVCRSRKKMANEYILGKKKETRACRLTFLRAMTADVI